MQTFSKKVIEINHHNRNIYGVLYTPDHIESYPLVIFSHGYNGTHKEFSKQSEYLAERGIGCYCFDFCGGSNQSKSDLKTEEMTIFTEQEDLAAVLNFMSEHKGVDSNQIFLFGGSQGGLVSSLVTEKHQALIKGLLLLFPAFCIPDNWTERFPNKQQIPEDFIFWDVKLGQEFFKSIHGFNVFEHIGSFSKDVLIFHGDQDDIVPLSYGKRAVDVYPLAHLEIFEGEGHGFKEAATKKVCEMTYSFINKLIKK